MFRRSLFCLSVLCLISSTASAEEIRALPPTVKLNGPHASQQLVVVQQRGPTATADLTQAAKFTSSNPKVATVDESGVVRAIGNGEATITTQHQSETSTVKVMVSHADQPFQWSFRNHVIPVMTKIGCNSGACHGALAGKGGLKLSLRGYAPTQDHFVLTRQTGGRRINLLQPAQSLFLRKPTMVVKHGGGRKLEVDSHEFRLLADWIASGAPGPKAADARITNLEVFPRHAALKPKDTMQIVVRASYSDGTSLDVTRWARFGSTQDLVATVDGLGQVKVNGHGEASITVVYDSLVALSAVTSPLTNDLDAKVFAGAKRNNFIDDLILKKLMALNIPPSAPCDDYAFIRRAYLDAAGILPQPQEVKRFVADKSPGKRAKLIDSLLARPEYVDYWAYKWSDVFLVSSRKLQEPAMWAFYQHIRQSVADNKAWDQFAREIVTARGSNLQNGAANYFVMHTDVSDLTETTAVTFLGMSVTCCRCHNHPLEKWTQDQYWSLANLFSRVKLRNGERGGEILVLEQPRGDVPHLRRGTAMPPAPLDAKALPLDSDKDRREYFADWLTAKNNPYFARAAVNRIWKNFMGRGLVEAEDDMRQTNPPSNPELLDALTDDFIKHNYDVKYLIKTIMNSAAYQRSSKPLVGNKSDDRYYSRYLVRRLKAEVALDAYSHVTGVPTSFTKVNLGASGGTKNTSSYPAGTRALQLPDTLVVSQFLDAFGRPQRDQPCSCERQQDSSVSQALQLSNGKTLNDKLRSKQSRVSEWVKEKINNDEAIERIFLLALSRRPTDAERARLRGLMTEAERDPQTSRREILEDLFWAVLTGREFLFNH